MRKESEKIVSSSKREKLLESSAEATFASDPFDYANFDEKVTLGKPIEGSNGYHAELENRNFIAIVRDTRSERKSENFRFIQLHKPKFHISIKEDSIEKGWNLVKNILIGNQVNHFKVVKPGVRLSELRNSLKYEYFLSNMHDKKEAENFHHANLEIKISVSEVEEYKGSKLLHSYALKFTFLSPSGDLKKYDLPLLSFSKNADLTEIKKNIVEHCLSKIGTDAVDQRGKEITVYLASNLEKTISDWNNILKKITETLVENEVPVGYQPSLVGDRADKKIDGTDYVTYRYEKPPSEDEFNQLSIKLDSNVQSFYEKKTTLHPLKRIGKTSYSVSNDEIFLLTDIAEKIKISHETYDILSATSSSEEVTDSSTESSNNSSEDEGSVSRSSP